MQNATVQDVDFSEKQDKQLTETPSKIKDNFKNITDPDELMSYIEDAEDILLQLNITKHKNQPQMLSISKNEAFELLGDAYYLLSSQNKELEVSAIFNRISSRLIINTQSV